MRHRANAAYQRQSRRGLSALGPLPQLINHGVVPMQISTVHRWWSITDRWPQTHWGQSFSRKPTWIGISSKTVNAMDLPDNVSGGNSWLSHRWHSYIASTGVGSLCARVTRERRMVGTMEWKLRKITYIRSYNPDPNSSPARCSAQPQLLKPGRASYESSPVTESCSPTPSRISNRTCRKGRYPGSVDRCGLSSVLPTNTTLQKVNGRNARKHRP